eukprot:jgi/Mesen1/6805/ME000035S06186
MAGRILWITMWVSVLALLAAQISPAILARIQGPSTPRSRGSLLSSSQEERGAFERHGRRQHNQTSSSLLHLPVKPAPTDFLADKPVPRQGKSEAKLWRNPPDHGFKPCVERSPEYEARGRRSRGFLMVHANGGLNQMRAGICDMVAVARILNATLVIPELDKSSFWQDSSNFSDLFDMEFFIKSLKKDIRVVKRLPEEFRHAETARKYFKSWSSYGYYDSELSRLWQQYKARAPPSLPSSLPPSLPLLSTHTCAPPPAASSGSSSSRLSNPAELQVIRALKSDSRLANNGLPPDIQKLRCRVHYSALRFAPHIEKFGRELVRRMRKQGPYIALHLRYEPDMLAFSGCTHGLTTAEAQELTAIRMKTKHWRVKEIDASSQRALGMCPLTPLEIGMLLQALGFPNQTLVYVAAGDIYGGERRMNDLRMRFPNLLRKEVLATEEELRPFKKHQNALAALDYMVVVESGVFVPTYSGNMARAVEGHRRFLGHRKTILPDRKEMVRLFDRLERGEIEEGDAFAEAVSLIHMHRQGAPRARKGPVPGSKGRERHRTEEAFYTNPLPDCICQNPSFKRPGGKVVAVRRLYNSSVTPEGAETFGGASGAGEVEEGSGLGEKGLQEARNEGAGLEGAARSSSGDREILQARRKLLETRTRKHKKR